MRSSIPSGQLVSIDTINESHEGASIRTVGILQEASSGEFILVGLHSTILKLNTSDSLLQLKPGYPYLFIGEMRDRALNVRICRELIFKKFSLDYYLKVLPGCLYSK